MKLRYAMWALVGLFSMVVSARAELVTHLKLDGDLLDSGPGGNHGTFQAGAPVFVDGFDGTPSSAVQFNGTSDLISLTYTSGLPISTNPAFSIAMWVKGLPQVDKRIFSEASGTTGQGQPLYNMGTDNTAAPNTSGKLDIFIRNDGNTAIVNHRRSDRNIYDGNWHHVVWIDDNGKGVIYIDGVRDMVDFTYTRGTLTRNRTSIGGILRAAPGSWFAGTIDDVRLYSHALTEAEVLAIVPEPATCPGDADTHMTLDVTGPAGDLPGLYTLTSTGIDDSAEPILYTFVVQKDDGTGRVQFGPRTANSAQVNLTVGTWVIRASADDSLLCRDAAPDMAVERTIAIVAPPDLVSHWTFDGNLLDARPSGNHATFVGDVSANFVEGFDGNPTGALSVDGVDDYATALQASSLPIHTFRAFSIAFWVKGPPGQVDRRMFSEASTTTNTPLFNIGTDSAAAPQTSGKVDLLIRNDANVSTVSHRKSDRDALDDTWHHVAWVDDDGKAILYIDGIRDATDFTYTRGPLTTNTTSFGAIHRAAIGSFFTGALDDMRVYNYAITEAELLALIPEPAGCPAEADTTCTEILAQGPVGGSAGNWRFTGVGADVSGDPLIYTFVATGPAGDRIQVGPRAQEFADFSLTPGQWTVEATADDDLACRDTSPAARCSRTIEVLTEPARLVSRFALDGDLLDSETSANHGTFGGADVPLFTDGIDCTLNGALSLDGVDDLVRVANNSGLPIHIRPRFSLAMWVKGASGQVDMRIFAEASTTTNTPLWSLGTHAQGTDGTVDLYIRDDLNVLAVDHVRSTGTVFDGTWHHLVYTDDQGQGAFWIDGVRDPAVISYVRPTLTTDSTTLGGIFRMSGALRWFTGAIDDARIYNYVLTEAEIADLYGTGATQSCCPEEGDTVCTGLAVTGPEDFGPGAYLATATAEDGSGDAPIYTFTAQRGTEEPVVKGPQAEAQASFDLDGGAWIVSVSVDDDPGCPDQSPSSSCSQEVFVCPGQGDTVCTGLTVTGPAGGIPGSYTAAATATDGSADLIRYTFRASDGVNPPVVKGPQVAASAVFDLVVGSWTISVEVDDDPLCRDQAEGATCSEQVTVVPAGVGPFVRGDANADGTLDLTDGVFVFTWLFVGGDEPSCQAAANAGGEVEITLSSGIYILQYLFLGGPEPLLPFPACGRSTLEVDLSLGCASFPPCSDGR